MRPGSSASNGGFSVRIYLMYHKNANINSVINSNTIILKVFLVEQLEQPLAASTESTEGDALPFTK